MRRNHPVKGTIITLLASSGMTREDVDKIAYDPEYDDIYRDIVTVAKECQSKGFIVDTNKIGGSVSDAIKGVAGRRNTHVYTLVSRYFSLSFFAELLRKVAKGLKNKINSTKHCIKFSK